MTLVICSDKEMDNGAYSNIRNILENSQCPHESLKSSYPTRYVKMMRTVDNSAIYVYFDSPNASNYTRIEQKI